MTMCHASVRLEQLSTRSTGRCAFPHYPVNEPDAVNTP
jgi:hypothetical protein